MVESIAALAPGLPPSRPVAEQGAAHTATAKGSEGAAATGHTELTPEERAEIEALKRRDKEVRAHEQAHAAAGGPYAGQPSLQFQRGPDGRSYAVSGEVKIDTGKVPGNPAATIRKMETVKRAALAPSQPSAKDRQVAAEAQRKAQEARRELQEEKRADNGAAAGGTNDPVPPAGLATGYQRDGQPADAQGRQPSQARNKSFDLAV